MNREKPEQATKDKLSLSAVVAAIAASILALAGLVSENASAVKKLRVAQRFATDAPPSGALLGQSVLGSEWGPQQGQGRLVVLFNVAHGDEVGSIDFWNEVASRTRAKAPDIQFVGLCAKGQECGLHPGAEVVLTLLSSMDPMQMRAMAIAARQKRILLYSGGLHGSLLAHEDKQALAEEIIGSYNQRPPVDRI